MPMLCEQKERSFQGQTSRMVAPVQETVKPVPVSSYRVGVDLQEMAVLTKQIRALQFGWKQFSFPMGDPRVEAMMAQLRLAKVRIHLAKAEKLLVCFNMNAGTVTFFDDNVCDEEWD